MLSVAVYNHYKRIASETETDDVELQKSNILLLGPTGCGKTLLAQTLARILDVPFTIADATSVTEAGYVGEDVESILVRLLQAADWEVEQAEMGIIYIDEIDKIARKTGDNPSITRDVSGEGVQQALLKIIEGTVRCAPHRRTQTSRKRLFPSIRAISSSSAAAPLMASRMSSPRVGAKGRFGFNESSVAPLVLEKRKSEMLAQVTSEDLLHFGLIPEFIGRLPVLVSVDPLDEDALIEILTQPKNAIVRQFQRLLALDGVEVHFTQEALAAVAKAAMKEKTAPAACAPSSNAPYWM